ncbi:MAG: hypothetical protein PWP21_947 [Thermosediminibacterales bacterium]|nr:hypothetical protein [Thermosediminibacterales bacterium]
MNKILVSGYYGFGNAGDEAILAAIVKSFKKIQQIQTTITVLSNNPEETRKKHGINAVKRTNPVSILKAIAGCDILLSGGGGLLQDITSSRSISYYLSLIFLAKKMGKKVMVYGNGVGPVKRNANRKLIRSVLNKVDLITVRDERSKKELQNMGVVNSKITVTADPALMLDDFSTEPGDELIEGLGIENNNKGLIGISVRKWKKFKETSSEIARWGDYLIKNHGFNLLFIPMHFYSDVEAAREIASKMANKPYIIEQKIEFDQIQAVVSKLDLLVGMRLHSLIFSALSSVPMVGLEYDPKVTEFLKQVDQPSGGKVGKIDHIQLIKLSEEILKNKEEHKEKLKDKVAQLKEKAFNNTLLAAELLER